MPVRLRQLPATPIFNVKSNIFAPRGILVGTTPIMIVPGNVDARLSIWVANDSTATVYLGGTNNLSATAGQGNTGWPLWQQTAIFLDDVDHELWVVGTAAGQSVMFVELFRPDDAGRGFQLEGPPAAREF